MVHMMVMTSAIQPMAMDALTKPKDPVVSEPVIFSYTLTKTGRMTATVKMRMTLMMHRSAAG